MPELDFPALKQLLQTVLSQHVITLCSSVGHCYLSMLGACKIYS